MNASPQLHDLGQSLWLDNITRPLLTSGTLARDVNDFALTGLTSNPTIFEHAMGPSGEALIFGLVTEDLTRAADLFRPAFDASAGVDGWVSLEVSPAAGDNADAVGAKCRRAGAGDAALAALLQREGAAVIRNSRHALSGGLQARREACTPANAP